MCCARKVTRNAKKATRITSPDIKHCTTASSHCLPDFLCKGNKPFLFKLMLSQTGFMFKSLWLLRRGLSLQRLDVCFYQVTQVSYQLGTPFHLSVQIPGPQTSTNVVNLQWFIFPLRIWNPGQEGLNYKKFVLS